jgi:hypothetical protein
LRRIASLPPSGSLFNEKMLRSQDCERGTHECVRHNTMCTVSKDFDATGR